MHLSHHLELTTAPTVLFCGQQSLLPHSSKCVLALTCTALAEQLPEAEHDCQSDKQSRNNSVGDNVQQSDTVMIEPVSTPRVTTAAVNERLMVGGAKVGVADFPVGSRGAIMIIIPRLPTGR